MPISLSVMEFHRSVRSSFIIVPSSSFYFSSDFSAAIKRITFTNKSGATAAAVINDNDENDTTQFHSRQINSIFLKTIFTFARIIQNEN